MTKIRSFILFLMAAGSTFSAFAESKYELKITSLTGSFELPIEVEWGINFFAQDTNTNSKHEGTSSKECIITENKSSSILLACGSFTFSNNNNSLFLSNQKQTELLFVQPYSKTDGYGISGNSTTFKNCMSELLPQPVGSECHMELTDEGVRYILSLIKTS